MKLHLDYRLIGKSKNAILFLHGWGLNKSYFDKCINRISDDYSKVSLDFFGFGKSSCPDEYFDVYEYAYYVFLLIKKLNLNKIVIVGHSFGGRIAIILSSLFNINIGSLILTSSAGINRFSLIKFFKIKFYKLCKYLVAKNVIPERYVRKFGSNDYKKLDSNMQKVFVRTVTQDLRRWVHLIIAKTYLVWDKKDTETPLFICKFLHRNMKNTQIILFSHGGHFAYISNNNKFVNVINNAIADNK